MRKPRVLTRVLALVIAMATALVLVVPAFAAASTNLDQWANLAGQGWQNGDVNGNNSLYHEGDVIPFRLAIEGLTSTGPHTIDLSYEFTAGGHKAYDFLATWNATENPNLCATGGGAVSSMCAGGLPSPSTFAFPTDPSGEVNAAEVAFGSNRNLTIYGGTITSISSPVLYSGGANGSGTITVTFNATGTCSSQTPCPVLLTWGGHLARTVDYAAGGAGTISGAPWHMRTQNLDGSGSANQDRSIQSSAIQPVSTATPTPTNTPTNTATPTQTRTPTPTNTVPPGSTATFTPTPTNTVPPGSTATFTPTPTNTVPPGSTATFTPTNTPTATPKPSNPPSSGSSQPANTPISTNTSTPVPTHTPTPRPTQVSAQATPRVLPKSGGIAPIGVGALGALLMAGGLAARRRLRRK